MMLNIVSAAGSFVTVTFNSVHVIHRCNHSMKPCLLNPWLVLCISLYFTERDLEFCDFFLHWLLSVVKGFISVTCSAVKSFILLSSFRGINLISLSKQDCLIYFNY